MEGSDIVIRRDSGFDVARLMVDGGGSKILALDNVDLEFEPDALRALARDALARKTGARGLRAAMEKIMTDIMYNVAGGKSAQKVVITAAMVEEGLK